MNRHLILIIIVLSIGFGNNAYAQTSPNSGLASVMSIDYGFTLPYNLWLDSRDYGHTQYIYPSWYKAKLYYDNQLKDWEYATKEANPTLMYAKFKIPNSDCYLCAMDTDVGPHSNCTDVLIIADAQGRVYDELLCTLQGEAMIIKQYSIDKDMKITVYSIEPDESKSVSLWDVNGTYIGHRVDRTYKISGNKFVLTKTVTGKKRTIKASDFKKGQWDLWDPFWKI